MSSGSPSLWPLAWFLVVVALIPVSLWLVKRSPIGARLGGAPLAGGAAPVRAVATLSLGPGQRVVTVEVGQGEARRWLVLGVTATQVTTLHTLDVPPGTDAGATASPTMPTPFSAVFGALRRDGGSGTPPGAA